MVSTAYRRLEQGGSNVHPDAMSARSMCSVMRELGVSSHTRFVSLGASDGRAMLSAAMLGAATSRQCTSGHSQKRASCSRCTPRDTLSHTSTRLGGDYRT